MKKYTISFVGMALILGLMLSMSACLDPADFDGDCTSIDLTGDFFFTDVTAGAFVITNLSRSIKVTDLTVEHPDYKETRSFKNVPEPLSSRAVLVNASEDNYRFTIKWVLAGASGENPIIRSLTMPASRMVREYFLFRTNDGEVVLVDSLEEARQRGDPADTVFEFTFIQRDPVIEVIAQNLFEARNSGPLIIRNGTDFDLSGLQIVPRTAQLRNQMTEFELDYVLSWRPTLRPRNPSILEYPSTGIRVRAGDYVVLHKDVEIAEVSVQPETTTHFGITNSVTIMDKLEENGGTKPPDPPPCECEWCQEKPGGCDCTVDKGDPKCDEKCVCDADLPFAINRIEFLVLSPWFSTTSNAPQPVQFTGNLQVNQSLSYFIYLNGPGSYAERQETANKRVVTFGPGIEYEEGIARVRKVSNTGAWIKYTVPAQFNGGVEVSLTLNF